MNFFEVSNTYRDVATKFLQNSRLTTVLNKYGRIEYEGAYAGNVMMHGDVDIKVIRDADYTQDEVFVILKDIHETCGDSIKSLFIKADWDDPRFGQQYPYGKYIGLKTLINDERCNLLPVWSNGTRYVLIIEFVFKTVFWMSRMKWSINDHPHLFPYVLC